MLRGLDLHIRAGETVSIIGHNGSGKSTVSYLLLRLLSPDAVRVWMGGQDIVGLNLAYLRRQIGLVPQLQVLFHASVLDKVA